MAALVVGVPVTAQWRHDVAAYVTDHASAGVELVVLHDSEEALSTRVDALVVDDTTDFLTPAQVIALSDQGVRVVGLFHGGREGRGREWLTQLGIDSADTLDVGVEPAALLDALVTVDVSSFRRRRNGAVPAVRPAYVPVQRRAPQAGKRGVVVVVVGGSDSPGRSEVAVSVADRLATSSPTILVDLDDQNPSVAARLGLQPAPNVLDALTSIRSGDDVRGCLARRASFARAHPPGATADVLCGLANPADWGELRDVPGLLDALASIWEFVVVDIGATVSSDERNAAARAAVGAADVLWAVCRATPLGVVRLLTWAGEAAGLLDRKAMMTVVMNQAPTDGFRRGELAALLARLPTRLVGGLAWLDRDPAVEAAVWDAVPVRKGRFVSGIDQMVAPLRAGIRGEPTRRSLRNARGGGGR